MPSSWTPVRSLLLTPFICLLVCWPAFGDLSDALKGAGETPTDPPANTETADASDPAEADAPEPDAEAPALELPNLTRDEAMQLMDVWIKEIDRDKETLNSYYHYGKNSKRTLGNAFEAAGAQDRHSYVDSWSGWLYMDWDSASNFYRNQAYELRKSQSTIRTTGHLTPGQLNYLANGMQAYRHRHEEIADVMAQRVVNTARRLYYMELEEHDSEEVQAIAKAAGQVNDERGDGIRGRIRSYSSDLVFYAVKHDEPMDDYAPREGLPPHNPVINADGDGEIPMDELIRMFNEDLKLLKEMRQAVSEGKSFDAHRYGQLDSRLLSIAQEIQRRGGTLPEEIPRGRPRYNPETANPNESEDDATEGGKPIKLGPPPTKPVKPIALPKLGNTTTQKKLNKDVSDSEKELFDHLMTKRDDWDLKSALDWDGKRHRLIGKATKAQQTLALAAAGSHSPEELKRLREISKGFEQLAKDQATDKELVAKFDSAKKLLDDYIAVNTALNNAGSGYGPVHDTARKLASTPGIVESAMKFGNYRAWHDAEAARTAMWKHQAQMNTRMRELMRAHKKLLNDRLVRGQDIINESLKQAGQEPSFRVHRDRDYIKTNGQAVKNLLGPSGRRVLIEQSSRRHQAGKVLKIPKD